MESTGTLRAVRNGLRALILAAAAAAGALGHSAHALPANAASASNFGPSDLRFERNAGQTDERVAFLARGPGFTVFLEPTISSLVMIDGEGRGAVVKLKLLGADHRATPAGLEALPGRANYYTGNDRSRWITDVSAFGRVRIQDVYRGIDLLYYGREGQLEYDFVVDPGIKPSAIRMEIEGADRLRIDEDGGLMIEVAGREIRWHKPVIYQESVAGAAESEQGARTAVQGEYVLTGTRRVGFRVGPYDRSRPLVIDPALDYATYLGGTDFTLTQEEGQGITADAAGNAAVVGLTPCANFPTTSGAFQKVRNSPAGNSAMDAFVTKLNANGTGLIFSTYIGGTKIEQYGGWKMGVAIGSTGDVFVAGMTESNDFPITAGVFQPAMGESDPLNSGGEAFVARISTSGALVWSSFLGGNGLDRPYCLDLDGSDNAYVGGYTAATTSFPTTPGAYQTTGTGFISKISADGSSLVWSTRLSGVLTKVQGCVVDDTGHVYATGFSNYGVNTLVTTPGVFQPTTGGGGTDAFVAKLNPDGASAAYVTWLGGTGGDDGWGIAVNAQGEAVVAGNTGGGFPVTAGAYQQTFGGTPYNDAFVAKINADATAIIWASYLGKSADDGARGVGYDDQGRVWVAGNTSAHDFPTTADGLQKTWGANWYWSPYLARFSADGAALDYATYFNDNGTAVLQDMAVDSSGRAYMTGECAAGLPTTSGAYDRTLGGVYDAWVARFSPGGGGGGTDTDGDGVVDGSDNCPQVSNANQADGDSDGVGTVCDNCPTVNNPSQTDTDTDGTGDACEAGPADADGDGITDATDNCPSTSNADQADFDDDGTGDVCDLTITQPLAGATLDCSNPAAIKPTIVWDKGPYDRFKVFVGNNPAFTAGTMVTSGDTLLSATSWTPGTKKWKKACTLAKNANPGAPVLYIRIKGVDKQIPAGHPGKTTYAGPLQVSVTP